MSLKTLHTLSLYCLEIIRKAKNNKEIEYFIYALDDSSKILTAELVKAAERGVKVRVLVDKSSTVFQQDEYYAQALKEAGDLGF